MINELRLSVVDPIGKTWMAFYCPKEGRIVRLERDVSDYMPGGIGARHLVLHIVRGSASITLDNWWQLTSGETARIEKFQADFVKEHTT